VPRRLRSWVPLLALPAALAAHAAADAPAGLAGAIPRYLQREGEIVVGGAPGVPVLPLPPRARPRSLVAEGGGWLVAGAIFEREDRSELWLARGSAAGWRAVEPPAERTGALRQGPLLLAGRDSVAGLAWLEGDAHDRLAVRWADRRGEGFAPPVTVVPPGPGSQLALAGAVLPDGTRLLVWAGFDGEDDEIWWSRSAPRGAWSAPARLAPDDEWPDVTPAVAVAGAGALVAWSGYDGSEYRLELARFESDRFVPLAAPAPPGSLDPSFERAAPGAPLLLLHFDARDDAWVASEIDELGRPGRSARIAGRSQARPLVVPTPDGVRWRGAAGEAESRWQRDAAQSTRPATSSRGATGSPISKQAAKRPTSHGSSSRR
jgi:hypothetical protein